MFYSECLKVTLFCLIFQHCCWFSSFCFGWFRLLIKDWSALLIILPRWPLMDSQVEVSSVFSTLDQGLECCVDYSTPLAFDGQPGWGQFSFFSWTHRLDHYRTRGLYYTIGLCLTLPHLFILVQYFQVWLGAIFTLQTTKCNYSGRFCAVIG